MKVQIWMEGGPQGTDVWHVAVARKQTGERGGAAAAVRDADGQGEKAQFT